LHEELLQKEIMLQKEMHQGDTAAGGAAPEELTLQEELHNAGG
jgi:hypothetical protein